MVKPTASDEFGLWLPGELVYSACKAGYDKKIERAKKPPEDRQSIYGFLGSEWDNHRFLASQGAHYQPRHSMSAQLQLAKFAAGLFDKVSLGAWHRSGAEAKKDHFIAAANQMGKQLLEVLPFEPDPEAAETLNQPFKETYFAPGVLRIMRGIALASELSADIQTEVISHYQATALKLGVRAAGCYLYYAQTQLTEDQYCLPVSELEA